MIALALGILIGFALFSFALLEIALWSQENKVLDNKFKTR